MKHTWILGLLVLVALSGCEDYVDIDIPQQEKKIVAYSFISPQDTMIKVFVGNSVPLFANTQSFQFEFELTNATVKLTDGLDEIIVPFNYDTFNFEYPSNEYPIVPGKTYTLTISAEGYKTITAQTTVPSHTPLFESTELVLLQEDNNNGFGPENRYAIDMKWNDIAGTENYYSVNIFSTYGEFTNPDARYYFTDRDADGTTLSRRAETYSYVYPDGGSTPSFRVYLLNVNSDYYLYHRSIENITYGDPFSEPTITYTNFENGLGCFGAFNGSSVVIEQ